MLVGFSVEKAFVLNEVVELLLLLLLLLTELPIVLLVFIDADVVDTISPLPTLVDSKMINSVVHHFVRWASPQGASTLRVVRRALLQSIGFKGICGIANDDNGGPSPSSTSSSSSSVMWLWSGYNSICLAFRVSVWTEEEEEPLIFYGRRHTHSLTRAPLNDISIVIVSFPNSELVSGDNGWDEKDQFNTENDNGAPADA